MEPTEPAAGRCVGQLVISVVLTAMALVTSPDRRFLQPRRSGRLRDPRLASFVRWDTIGASKSSPSRCFVTSSPGTPGAFFTLCVSAGTNKAASVALVSWLRPAANAGHRHAEPRIPGTAAQTRLVSRAGIRLGPWESARAFKGIICLDISEFESHMPSQLE